MKQDLLFAYLIQQVTTAYEMCHGDLNDEIRADAIKAAKHILPRCEDAIVEALSDYINNG